MDQTGGVTHRAIVMDLLSAALAAVDPYAATLKAFASRPGLAFPDSYSRVYVVGAGKAGAEMASAAEDALGGRITGGLVIVKEGYGSAAEKGARRIEMLEAGHPVPDSRGAEGTRRLLEMANEAGEGDLLLCLISGGGSALMVAPVDGVSLEDTRATTGLLLRSGATINELNAVRKHLSRVSGGQLARAAYPARIVSLILSDVTGSPLDVIASGPTAPDPTTYEDALDVLERRGVSDTVPRSVLSVLRQGAVGELPETPKPGDPVFDRVDNVIVASNVSAVEAAARRAHELGLNTFVMSTFVEGEAREVGTVLAGLAREVATYQRPVAPPACLLFGGETTVTVRGTGVGGRNSELALAAAQALDGLGPGVVLASFATDGGDGTSPGAGAIADGTTIDRSKVMGLDADAALANNDTYSFWARLGNAIVTGPTGTNVNDLMAILVL